MRLHEPCLAILAVALASCSSKSAGPPPPVAPTPPRSPGYYTKLYPIEGSPGIYRTKFGKQLDIRGFPSGMEVRDPYSKEVYLIP